MLMFTTFELWPCGQPSPGDPHAPVAHLVFTEQLAWNGQTDWVYKGRGIKVISTKYTSQSVFRIWADADAGWGSICWLWAGGRAEAL